MIRFFPILTRFTHFHDFHGFSTALVILRSAGYLQEHFVVSGRNGNIITLIFSHFFVKQRAKPECTKDERKDERRKN